MKKQKTTRQQYEEISRTQLWLLGQCCRGQRPILQGLCKPGTSKSTGVANALRGLKARGLVFVFTNNIRTIFEPTKAGLAVWECWRDEYQHYDYYDMVKAAWKYAAEETQLQHEGEER